MVTSRRHGVGGGKERESEGGGEMSGWGVGGSMRRGSLSGGRLEDDWGDIVSNQIIDNRDVTPSLRSHERPILLDGETRDHKADNNLKTYRRKAHLQ